MIDLNINFRKKTSLIDKAKNKNICRNFFMNDSINGGRYWIRTSDPLLVRQALFR